MKRRDFLRMSGVGLGALAASRLGILAAEAAQQGLNVLWIGVDDLRCNLGCYGDKVAVTPNIDRLAARGTVFSRAYVQQAVCSASRASLLTGCRPDTTGVDYPYNQPFIDTFLPAHPSLPVYFQRHGFGVETGGKIHHGFAYDLKDLGYTRQYWYRNWYFDGEGLRVPVDDHRTLVPDEQRWKQARDGGIASDYALRDNLLKDADKNEATKPAAFECLDVADTDYRDGRLADATVDALDRAARDGKPFCFASGFYKPHLPFTAPKRYWDLYDRAASTLPENRFLAGNVTRLAPASYELPAFEGGQLDFKDEARLRLLTHAYYACTSFTDANIGKVLDALERLKLADRTIVMLWSDHGFHLGENESFGKHTCFEVATRSPLIVAAPGFKGGQVCRSLVEYVDMFPTLCELSGVPNPDYLEGASLVPLLEDPGRTIKDAAFSQWPRNKNAEGFSIRTDRYRYTEWRSESGKGPEAGSVLARELYDHTTDPGESVNRADAMPDLVAELSRNLHDGWRSVHRGARRIGKGGEHAQ